MNPPSKIGEEGKMINFSMAGSAMNIEPDINQVKKYDEYPAKRNPLFYVALVFALSSAVATFFFFSNGSWIWGSLFILLTLVFFLFVRSYNNPLLMKRIAYESGLIIPAVITETQPLTLLALADIRGDEEKDLVWGCRKIIVHQLPHHHLCISEKIPCASLFGMSVKGYRRYFEPRPISWGFPDENHRQQALESIGEEEWHVLAQLEPQMKEVPKDLVVFFDKDLNKIESL